MTVAFVTSMVFLIAIFWKGSSARTQLMCLAVFGMYALSRALPPSDRSATAVIVLFFAALLVWLVKYRKGVARRT
jgi:hypothetical protein